MNRNCLTALVLLVLGGPATVHGSTLDELRRTMDCDGYRFTDGRQRIGMQDTPPVWSIVNEGPASVAIFIGNPGASLMDLPADPGRSVMFFGDAAYSYTLGLAAGGSAVAYICRNR